MIKLKLNNILFLDLELKGEVGISLTTITGIPTIQFNLSALGDEYIGMILFAVKLKHKVLLGRSERTTLRIDTWNDTSASLSFHGYTDRLNARRRAEWLDYQRTRDITDDSIWWLIIILLCANALMICVTILSCFYCKRKAHNS
jgi:hypothetical protein